MIPLLVCAACGGRIDVAPEDATVDSISPGDAAAPADSSSDVVDEASFVWPDAALLDPCRDAGWSIHVDVDGGYPMYASSATITGDVGTWSCAMMNESFLQLNVATDAPWQLNALSDWLNGQVLAPGTYASSGSVNKGSYMQIEVAGQGCSSAIPTGTFTIYDLVAAQGDNVPVSRLLMSFVLHCAGQGTLSGCARFGN